RNAACTGSCAANERARQRKWTSRQLRLRMVPRSLQRARARVALRRDDRLSHVDSALPQGQPDGCGAVQSGRPALAGTSAESRRLVSAKVDRTFQVSGFRLQVSRVSCQVSSLQIWLPDEVCDYSVSVERIPDA